MTDDTKHTSWTINALSAAEVDAAYEAASKKLLASMEARYTYAIRIANGMYSATPKRWARESLPPAALCRQDGLLRLIPEAKYIKDGHKQTLGIQLTIRAQVEGGGDRVVQTQAVKRSTPVNEQLRLLEAMCNIVAVQEGCDYKLVHKLRSVQPIQENRYGL